MPGSTFLNLGSPSFQRETVNQIVAVGHQPFRLDCRGELEETGFIDVVFEQAQGCLTTTVFFNLYCPPSPQKEEEKVQQTSMTLFWVKKCGFDKIPKYFNWRKDKQRDLLHTAYRRHQLSQLGKHYKIIVTTQRVVLAL